MEGGLFMVCLVFLVEFKICYLNICGIVYCFMCVFVMWNSGDWDGKILLRFSDISGGGGFCSCVVFRYLNSFCLVVCVEIFDVVIELVVWEFNFYYVICILL